MTGTKNGNTKITTLTTIYKNKQNCSQRKKHNVLEQTYTYSNFLTAFRYT